MEMIYELINHFENYISLINQNEISLKSLKYVSTNIILADLYNRINNESKCMRNCTTAMEIINKIHKWVSPKDNLTKFSFLSICVLFYEKMFFIFSKLSQKFNQNRTELFLYLKLIDLGPIFDLNIRKKVFKNIIYFMKREFRKQSISNLNPLPEEGNKIIFDKIKAMKNMIKESNKNITYLIDVNCPFLLQKEFKYTLEKIRLSDNCGTINFQCFNEDLISFNINMSKDQNLSEIFSIDQSHFCDKISKLDNAIFKTIENFKVEKTKNNNYLFILTNIDSGFDFSDENLTKINKKIFKEQFYLILLIFWDVKINDSPELIKKLDQLRSWIENKINGIIIIIKNFSMIEKLLTCNYPIKFKENDQSALKKFTFIDINVHLEVHSKKSLKNQPTNILFNHGQERKTNSIK